MPSANSTEGLMQLSLTLATAAFVCVAAPASAAETDAIFPPVNCAVSGYNILTWDGAHNVICLPFPVCPGPAQYLSYDGRSVTCQPQGDEGVPAYPGGVPTPSSGG